MPKEVITSRWFGQKQKVLVEENGRGSKASVEEVLIEKTGLHIGWDKGGNYVQVAILEVDEQCFEQPSPYNWLTEDAQFMQLDRDGINRAIRALRRARDAAFGADA